MCDAHELIREAAFVPSRDVLQIGLEIVYMPSVSFGNHKTNVMLTLEVRSRWTQEQSVCVDHLGRLFILPYQVDIVSFPMVVFTLRRVPSLKVLQAHPVASIGQAYSAFGISISFRGQC